MKSEVAEAVENAALGVREAGSPAAEQTELFALPIEVDAKTAENVEQVRKAGRPPGAVNKASRDLREWLLRKGVLPQASLMQWVQGGPELVLSWVMRDAEGPASPTLRLEVLSLWFKTSLELGQFLLPKMTPVDDAGRAVPTLLMVMPDGRTPIAADAVAPWLKEMQENQALIEADAPQSQSDEPQP